MPRRRSEEEETVGIVDLLRSQFVEATSEAGSERTIVDTIERVLDEYFATKDLRQKTELSKNEILFLTRLRAYQHLLESLGHNPEYIKITRDEFMSLKVSHERRGRREITNIFTALLSQEQKREEEEEENILKKLFKVKTD